MQVSELGPYLRKQINELDELHQESDYRTHLGASVIGTPCLRQQWYGFRWMKKPNHRASLVRLFARGHREEQEFIKRLKAIGFDVADKDPMTKSQYLFSALGGHYGGSLDAILFPPENLIPVIGSKILGEFKTHNTKSFCHLAEKGLVMSKPRHYDQMCTYGARFNLAYGLYFALNKNDDDIHIEIVKLSRSNAADLERKAEYIIDSETPPGRIKNDPTHYECKMCDFLNICHYQDKPDMNCRSCKNARAVDGGWHCNLWASDIPKEYIRKGCPQWTSANV